MREFLQQAAMTIVDWVMAAIPRPVPPQRALRNCKIISHRGEHDNKTIIENTLPAFELARANGVWGIECDLRWTADLVPVLSHDACGRRLFDNPLRIASVTFAQLRQQLPQIPSLAELVEQFGGHIHLMLEIKDEDYPQPQRQKIILAQQLAALSAGIDYHFLALDRGLFERVDFVASRHHLAVAEINTRAMSQAVLDGALGGLTGHFLLLSPAVRARHRAAGQRIGTGFIRSKNCLFRELNANVEWIFSNDALKIQKIRDAYLDR